jgi:hypothetical protein
MDSWKGIPITTPKNIPTYQDKPYTNKFNKELKSKWFIRTSGQHFQDAKIFDSNAMIELQYLKYKKFQESIFDYDWEIQISTKYIAINNFSTSFIVSFNNLFEAK